MRRINWNLDSDEPLEGRVFVYSKFVNTTGKEMIVNIGGQNITVKDYIIYATYNSTNPRDIAIKKEVAPEDLESAVKKMEKVTEEWKKNNGMLDNPKNTHFYKIFFTLESEDDLAEFDDEAVPMGEYNNIESCVRAVDLGEDIYFLKLKAQVDKKKLGTQKKTMANQTFKSLVGRSIKDELLFTYINPMIDAQKSGNESVYTIIKSRLLGFSEGAQFNTDIQSLCGLIEKGQTRPNMYIIQTYLEKIDAIHTEDYAKAARMRDEIAKILADPKKES